MFNFPLVMYELSSGYLWGIFGVVAVDFLYQTNDRLIGYKGTKNTWNLQVFYIKKALPVIQQIAQVLFSFLKLDREAGMDIDARLSIIPTAAAAVGEAARFCTTIIRILGIEDIIDLTHEADIGVSAMGYWQ